METRNNKTANFPVLLYADDYDDDKDDESDDDKLIETWEREY